MAAGLGGGDAAAPFLKWVGGKRQLLGPILAGRPAAVRRYFEPFVGGGAVLFALPHPGSKCVAADINGDLVNAYEVVRDEPDALLAELKKLEKKKNEQDYYAVRASRPRTPVKRAARLIYLNKTCFNGLYRENRRGEFNVPWGGGRTELVCNEPLIRAASHRLRGVRISTSDFVDVCGRTREGDWLYVDPPYIPLSASSSFAAYAKDGFGLAEHRKLAAAVEAAVGRGVNVMLSNSDTPPSREIYAALDLYTIQARRSVGATAAGRAKVSELIGVNYSTDDMVDADGFEGVVTPVR